MDELTRPGMTRRAVCDDRPVAPARRRGRPGGAGGGGRVTMLDLCRHPSPLGELCLVSDEAGLVALDFAEHEARMRRLLQRRYGAFRLVGANDAAAVTAGLQAYFAGDLAALDGLPADGGGTPFQRRVWRRLRAIPPGRTLSYAALAAALGVPKAVRAVAHANALNPIAIVVPCHRVIGSDGTLRGYAGGLERKRWLLRHEGARLQA